MTFVAIGALMVNYSPSADFFSKSTFFYNFFHEYHQCQTVGIKIRPKVWLASIG